jgi:hypothetical protein
MARRLFRVVHVRRMEYVLDASSLAEAEREANAEARCDPSLLNHTPCVTTVTRVPTKADMRVVCAGLLEDVK